MQVLLISTKYGYDKMLNANICGLHTQFNSSMSKCGSHCPPQATGPNEALKCSKLSSKFNLICEKENMNHNSFIGVDMFTHARVNDFQCIKTKCRKKIYEDTKPKQS